MASEQRTVEGTLLGGPDDAYYFIPKSKLEEFKLTREQASQVRELLSSEAEVQGFTFTSPEISILGGVIFADSGHLLPRTTLT